MDKRKARDAVLKDVFMTQLRRYRLAAGLNQNDLASAMKVSDAAVSKWENGMSMPRGDKFKKLARILGINPIDLTRMLDPEPETPMAGVR